MNGLKVLSAKRRTIFSVVDQQMIVREIDGGRLYDC